MIGIEKLKEDVVVISKVTAKFDKSLEDDKVSLMEGIGLAMEIPAIFSMAKGYKTSIKELKDLDEKEKVEIIEHFRNEFKLSSEKAEEIVEKIFEVLISLASAFLVAENLR